MISDKRKLFIQIGATAFRTSDKELLEKYVNAFVDKLTEEEIDYALSLFKEK